MRPSVTAATASGLEVKYDEIPRRILPCRNSFPSPRPGSPMLLETIVRSVASDDSTSASIRVSGAPTRPNPPTITVSPLRIDETASSGSLSRRATVTSSCRRGPRVKISAIFHSSQVG